MPAKSQLGPTEITATTSHDEGAVPMSRIFQLAAIAGWLLAVASVAGLVVVATAKDADALSTIALPLAILAFLIQIVVFMVQAWQSQQVTTQSTGLLSEVQTSVRGMERLLEQRYKDLLEAYTQERAQAWPTGSQVPEPAPDSPHLATAAAPDTPPPSPENLAVIARLLEWPTQEQAEAANGRLQMLSPQAISLFRRHIDAEAANRRSNSPWLGLWGSEGFENPTTELVDAGLLEELEPTAQPPAGGTGRYFGLTDLGRETARVLTAHPNVGHDEPGQ